MTTTIHHDRKEIVAMTTSAERPTTNAIVEVFRRAGMSPIIFRSPITRDGPGWSTDLILPYGTDLPAVLARRDELPHGWGVASGKVAIDSSTEADGDPRYVTLRILDSPTTQTQVTDSGPA